MKAFIVLLCVAAALAEPEADAQYLVNPYNAYTPYAYNAMVNPMYRYQPLVQTVAQPSVYYSKPVEYQSVVYKADEEKKPEEVKPVEYKAVPLTYNAMSYAPASPMYYALNPTYYGGAKYVAQSAGGVSHIVNKREAEPMEGHHQPTPMVYANPMGYYASPLAYSSPMSYYVNPLSYSAAAINPLSYSAAPVMPAYYNQMMYTPKTYSNDAMNANMYAAKGQYVADSVGARHVAKREADAQLPYYPTMAYNTPYTTPYAYNAYRAYTPYTPYTSLGYNAYNTYPYYY